MTKVFVATPVEPVYPITSPKKYQLSPDALPVPYNPDMLKAPDVPITTIRADGLGRGTYQIVGRSSFDFEINILDTGSELPIRAVEVKSGLKKGFTDRLGRLVMHLPRGRSKVIIEGHGYVETGDFAPKLVKFKPMTLEVDLDEDSVYTIYSSGEVIQGERKVLDNPGHGVGGASFDLETFLKQYGVVLGLIGVTGVAMYCWGKSRNSST